MFIGNKNSLWGGCDADAQLFIANAVITDTTQQKAICSLVTSLKVAGIWDKARAIYPFVGGTASTHKFNLKNPVDSIAAFSLEYLGNGVIHSQTGAKGAGDATSLTSTRLAASQELITVNNNHIAMYTRDAGGFGLYDSGTRNVPATEIWGLTARRSSDLAVYDSGSYTLNRASYTSLDAVGFHLGKVNNDLTSKLYQNGVLKTSNSITDQAQLSNLYFYMFGSNGSTSGYSSREFSFFSIGFGLSDEESIEYNAIVQAFQTTLNRQV